MQPALRTPPAARDDADEAALADDVRFMRVDSTPDTLDASFDFEPYMPTPDARSMERGSRKGPSLELPCADARRWPSVISQLRRDSWDSRTLVSTIRSLADSGRYARLQRHWSTNALEFFIDRSLTHTEREFFLGRTVPYMASLVGRMSEYFPSGSIAALSSGSAATLEITQMKAACLLAAGFFCVYDDDNIREGRDRRYPSINFCRMYFAPEAKHQDVLSAKLRCLVTYFSAIMESEPYGRLVFERRVVQSAPKFAEIKQPMCELVLQADGTIEDAQGMLQADFANKFIGGGVLGKGAVQEEIRFMINPELIVSRLFCERLGADETIVITGCERFADYDGYGNTFRFKALHKDRVPCTDGLRSTKVVAMDAINYSRNVEDQFTAREIDRELLKAFISFRLDPSEEYSPIATGNWGCGAFKGNLELKALIQLIAASVCRRRMVYFTFGDRRFCESFGALHHVLVQSGMTTDQLYALVHSFGRMRAARKTRLSLFEFVEAELQES